MRQCDRIIVHILFDDQRFLIYIFLRQKSDNDERTAIRIYYHSNLGLLNNRALFDTAFDPQSCLQDLSRPFRCTVCIREKVLYASSTTLTNALPAVAARCDVFKSLLLRYTDRALPRGWSTQPTIWRTLSIRIAISATSTVTMPR